MYTDAQEMSVANAQDIGLMQPRNNTLVEQIRVAKERLNNHVATLEKLEKLFEKNPEFTEFYDLMNKAGLR